MHLLKISSILGSAAIAGLLALSPAAAQNPVGEALEAATAPFIFGGRHYCWAPDGWHGPGWYWCGYEHRHGYGWGGGEGFHGWHHGERGRPMGRGEGRGHEGGHEGGHDEHHH